MKRLRYLFFHFNTCVCVSPSGGEFLLNHIKRPEDGRCYFQVTAEGQPIKIQKTLFTECYYALAMAELARATSVKKYRVRDCFTVL